MPWHTAGVDENVARIFDCADSMRRKEGIAAAIDAVRGGELIVIPTDTVYGVGADAFNPQAVGALLAAKRRGRDMPVPVLVGSRQTVQGLVTTLPVGARELMDAFWPGGLTLVVRHAPSLAWDLGKTAGTVALRMPLHPVALEVLAATGPLAVSSANISGRPPARTAEQAYEQLDPRVATYLESGEVGESPPSTIIDLTGSTPKVLRQGPLSLEELRDVVADIELA